MKYIFIPVRWVLGQIIIIIDWLTRPKKPDYSNEVQSKLDQATSSLALYHFKLCPFCVKTRRTVRRLGLSIETRDARNDPMWNAELISEGGKYQVPCLRIEEDDKTTWLYESTDINNYLTERFLLRN